MQARSIAMLSILAAGACSSSAKPCPTIPATAAAVAPAHGLQIKHAAVYVDDLDKALHYYTDVLGFVKKDDVRNGPYRWLTVQAPGDPSGAELQLALADNPAAKAYQQAMFAQHMPATMFYTTDLKGDAERLKAKGAVFAMPPTDVTASTIAQIDDTCGNLIQLTELHR